MRINCKQSVTLDQQGRSLAYNCPSPYTLPARRLITYMAAALCAAFARAALSAQCHGPNAGCRCSAVQHDKTALAHERRHALQHRVPLQYQPPHRRTAAHTAAALAA